MAQQIRAICSVITKVARTDLETHLKEYGAGISAIEHGMLRHLSRGVTSMSQISRLMGVAPSTLVYVVDGLTDKKLVRRVTDPKDRRREPLLLEEKGAELFARTSDMDASSILVRSLGGMPTAQRNELLSLLNELVKRLAGADRMYLDAKLEARADSDHAEPRRRRRKQ